MGYTLASSNLDQLPANGLELGAHYCNMKIESDWQIMNDNISVQYLSQKKQSHTKMAILHYHLKWAYALLESANLCKSCFFLIAAPWSKIWLKMIIQRPAHTLKFNIEVLSTHLVVVTVQKVYG